MASSQSPPVCQAQTASSKKVAAVTAREVNNKVCLLCFASKKGRLVMQAPSSKAENTIQNQLKVWSTAKLQMKQGIRAQRYPPAKASWNPFFSPRQRRASFFSFRAWVSSQAVRNSCSLMDSRPQILEIRVISG